MTLRRARTAGDVGHATGLATAFLALLSAGSLASISLVGAHDLLIPGNDRPVERAASGGHRGVTAPATVVVTPRAEAQAPPAHRSTTTDKRAKDEGTLTRPTGPSTNDTGPTGTVPVAPEPAPTPTTEVDQPDPPAPAPDPVTTPAPASPAPAASPPAAAPTTPSPRTPMPSPSPVRPPDSVSRSRISTVVVTTVVTTVARTVDLGAGHRHASGHGPRGTDDGSPCGDHRTQLPPGTGTPTLPPPAVTSAVSPPATPPVAGTHGPSRPATSWPSRPSQQRHPGPGWPAHR